MKLLHKKDIKKAKNEYDIYDFFTCVCTTIRNHVTDDRIKNIDDRHNMCNKCKKFIEENSK